jgi:hypothetical protein
MYEWRITRIRSTPAALIGHVEAADAERRNGVWRVAVGGKREFQVGSGSHSGEREGVTDTGRGVGLRVMR